ncbi:PDR/VanB family oxidoreductase [Crossiella sp. CA198]|uniref:PDR/VanB family oxidoreductase n=1 Tax=Crossiella sp. CA198 TaxID=3455607 RepID=UPI003F8D32FF
MPDPAIPVVVRAEDFPAADVRELTLSPAAGGKLPGFTPGAHIQLRHPRGVRRQYSLISCPDNLTRYRIAIRRRADGRGGSVAFHDDLTIGDQLSISPPIDGMKIDTSASQHVFIAGGIGLTPILGLLQALPEGARTETHYCVRCLASAPYLDALRESSRRVTVYDSSAGVRLNVTELIRSLPAGSTVYHCGPQGLMDAITTATADWPTGRVRGERFTPADPEPADCESFEVRFAAEPARVLRVGARETMLRALLREGVPIDYSCEKGECGTCVLEYSAGTVDHRDSVLTDDERNDMLTPCVSRARGRVVIDL